MTGWNAAYQDVQCKTCRRKYTCTPMQDYYNSTGPADGVCEPCLMKDAGLGTMVTVNENLEVIDVRHQA